MLLTNLHGLPDALVNAVRNDPYRGGGDISVTKLIDSPQRRALIKRHREHIVEDVSERIWALMGQAVHAVLERAQTTALVEQRLFAEVNGWTLSGQFDRAHLAEGVLQDYKVCSVFKAEGDESWTRQLNVLRWLLARNGMSVDKLQVVAIFRDWKKSEALRKETYPRAPVQVIDLEVWSEEQAQRYIEERVSLHQAVESGAAVECTEEDRWYSGTTYALMKPGGKRALKVSAVRSELGEPAPGLEIVERPGSNRRCEHYCEAAPFCPQFQKLKQSGIPSDDVDF